MDETEMLKRRVERAERAERMANERAAAAEQKAKDVLVSLEWASARIAELTNAVRVLREMNEKEAPVEVPVRRRKGRR